MKKGKTKPLRYGRGFFLLFRFFTLLFHGFVCAGNHLFRECLFLLVLQIHPCDADNIHPCQINLDVLLHGKHLIYRLIAHQRHNLRANLRAHQIGLANFWASVHKQPWAYWKERASPVFYQLQKSALWYGSGR